MARPFSTVPDDMLYCRRSILGHSWQRPTASQQHLVDEWNPRTNGFKFVKVCGRGCGTIVRSVVSRVTGEYVVGPTHHYDPGYQIKGLQAEYSRAEQNNEARLEMIGRESGRRRQSNGGR